VSTALAFFERMIANIVVGGVELSFAVQAMFMVLSTSLLIPL
jgi:hypothetical protein